MRTSRQGTVIFSDGLRDESCLNQDREAESVAPSARGLLIPKKTTEQHPVDRVCGILDGVCDVDSYVEEMIG